MARDGSSLPLPNGAVTTLRSTATTPARVSRLGVVGVGRYSRRYCGVGTRAPRGRDGFARIETGPEHPPYGNFCPAAGHHIGFNDLKVIEVAELIDAWCGRGKAYPDFAEAFAVQQTVDAVKESSRRHSWVEVASI